MAAEDDPPTFQERQKPNLLRKSPVSRWETQRFGLWNGYRLLDVFAERLRVFRDPTHGHVEKA